MHNLVLEPFHQLAPDPKAMTEYLCHHPKTGGTRSLACLYGVILTQADEGIIGIVSINV